MRRHPEVDQSTEQTRLGQPSGANQSSGNSEDLEGPTDGALETSVLGLGWSDVSETDRSNLAALHSVTEAVPVFEARDEVELDVPEASATLRSATFEVDNGDDDETLKRWPVVVLYAGVALAGVLALTLYFTVGSGGRSSVPELVGLGFEQAKSQVQDEGWELVRLEGRLDGSTPGEVVAQSPASGTRIGRGETIEVTVSLGEELVAIPLDLVGLDERQAQIRLGDAGLSVGNIIRENNDYISRDLVIGASEPTALVARGAAVSLRVSLGPPDRAVPD